MIVLIAVALAVVMGAGLQRISGMGLGLITGPVLSLLLGPVVGVLMINVIATVNAVFNTWGMRRDIDWSKFWPIAGALIIGVLPGVWVVSRVSTSALLIIVGALLLIALSVVTLGKRYVPQIEGVVPAAAAGAVGGFMNTLAGVAGPAFTVYAHAARWPQRIYAATLQPLFFVAGALSFGAKELSGAADISSINPWLWVASFGGMLFGITAGKRLAPHVPSAKAYRIALGLAFFGGATTLVRGLAGLLYG